MHVYASRNRSGILAIGAGTVNAKDSSTGQQQPGPLPVLSSGRAKPRLQLPPQAGLLLVAMRGHEGTGENFEQATHRRPIWRRRSLRPKGRAYPWSIARFGYPVTLGFDAIVGLDGLAILPYIAMGAPARRNAGETLRTAV